VLAAGQTAKGGSGGRLARLAGVALAAAAVSFAGIGSHSLWTPDEPRDAAIGKAMWASGDLVTPRLAGRPFLEKPPLAWWAQAAAFRVLGGASDATARVPSALFATLTLLAAYALGRRLGGERAGWLAAGVLASAAEFSEEMGRAIVDPPLVLAVTLAYFGLVVLVTPRVAGRAGGAGKTHYAESPEARGAKETHGLSRPREIRDADGGVHASHLSGRQGAAGRWGAHLLIALAVPVAFLAKGVAGVGLALGPPILYLLLAGARAGRGGGRRRLAANLRLLAPLALVGVPLFAALVLPWALALLHAGGWAALRECLVGNTLGRLLATEAGRAYGHRQPFWYYLPAGAAALLPWTLALPAALRGGEGGGSAPGGHRGDTERGGREGDAEPGPAGSAGGSAGEAHGAGGPAGQAPFEAGRRLLVASFLLGMVLLSLAASKRSLYLVPLLPAIAVPIGLWLDRLGGGRGRSPESASGGHWPEEAGGDSPERAGGGYSPEGAGGGGSPEGADRGDSPSGPSPRRRWDRPTALLLLAVAATLPLVLWAAAALAVRGAFHSFPVAPLRAELTTGRLAAAAAVALAGAGLLLFRLARHLRAGSTPTAPWLVLPYLAIALLYQTAIKAAIDPLKNPHDLTAAIARLDPGPGPVAAYRPSETTLGILDFDLGRPLRTLASPGEVSAFFAEQPHGRLVLSLAAWRHLPAPLRARLGLLYDEAATKASPFAIAAAIPEPGR
jgi:4-amino-4-deoxy-L-arabinose transferase-like glycosyltransferase